MQTNFSPAQLADPHMRALGADPALLRALRLLHRDLPDLCRRSATSSIRPRGRIYLIKDMLESGRAPTAEDVRPIDRCLSCLLHDDLPLRRRLPCASSITRAPTSRRPIGARCADSVLRAMLARLLPSRAPFPRALELAAAGAAAPPLIAALPRVGPRLAAMLALAPAAAGTAQQRPGELRRDERNRQQRRVALLTGCAQAVLAPQINAATIRLLNRAGIDVVHPAGRRLLRLALPSHGP